METKLSTNENEMTMVDEFITTVEKNSELVRAENGLSKIVIDNDFWEELKYQMHLKSEIEKDECCAKTEPSLTIDEFAKRIGLN